MSFLDSIKQFFSSHKAIQSIHDGAWLVKDLLTEDECNRLVNEIETKGFRKARLYDKGRHNKETFIQNQQLEESLIEKLSTFSLQDKNKSLRIKQMSTPIEFYKYDTGDYIKSHTDASRKIAEGIQSSLTIVLYLNDDYEGGETTFTRSHYSVQPKKGAALFFKQRLPHEASIVHSGTKYILRSDIAIY